MFKRILVPLDGSALAERAVPVAAQLARASGGSILLVGVVTAPVEYGPSLVPASGSGWGEEQTQLKEMSAYLQKTASSPLLQGGTVEVQAMAERVGPAILAAERTYQADLIVMSSHGYTGVKRWMLGSIAQKVARHSSIPVLVLHAAGAVLTADQPMRVLVPLDGSALAEAALEPAIQLATAIASTASGAIHLLWVIDVPIATGTFRAMTATFDREIQAQEEKTAHTYLQALQEHLRQTTSARLHITSSTVVGQDIASAIISTGEPDGTIGGKAYDLIAMATHGRSGIRRWALGSTTERVLGATSLPLLIVRPGVETEQHKPSEAGIKEGEVPWGGLL